MITADDNGLLLCHEEARQCLTYAVPGARVSIARVDGSVGRESTRSYTIKLKRDCGEADVCVIGAYTLPAVADRIASHAREQVEQRLKQ